MAVIFKGQEVGYIPYSIYNDIYSAFRIPEYMLGQHNPYKPEEITCGFTEYWQDRFEQAKATIAKTVDTEIGRSMDTLHARFYSMVSECNLHKPVNETAGYTLPTVKEFETLLFRVNGVLDVAISLINPNTTVLVTITFSDYITHNAQLFLEVFEDIYLCVIKSAPLDTPFAFNLKYSERHVFNAQLAMNFINRKYKR